MPRDKQASYERIIPAARKEFLEKGYEKASIRAIAKEAGLTSAGLYRHFVDKEAMFAALVEPFVNAFQKMFEEIKEKDYGLLDQGKLDEMWDGSQELETFLQIIYGDYDGAKLLICCAGGTRYENFLHELVLLEERETIAYLEAAKSKGIAVREVRSAELHLLQTAYITAIFEVVVHDFSREEAAHYLRTLKEFFHPGWRAVLGI